MHHPAAGGRHGRHLKSMTHVENPTFSIDMYLLEEEKLTNFIPLRSETTKHYFFRKESPQQEQEEEQRDE